MGEGRSQAAWEGGARAAGLPPSLNHLEPAHTSKGWWVQKSSITHLAHSPARSSSFAFAELPALAPPDVSICQSQGIQLCARQFPGREPRGRQKLTGEGA